MKKRKTPSDAPFNVLRDPSLVALITQFQYGIPLVIHELVVKHKNPLPYPMSFTLWPAVLTSGDMHQFQLLYRLRSKPGSAKIRDLRQQNLPRAAVVFGRLDVLQWLDANGFEADDWHSTLMFEAAREKQPAIAEWMLEHRPDACKDQNSAAMRLAVENGHLRLVQKLLEVGRGISISDWALERAGVNQHWDVVRFLAGRVSNQTVRNAILCSRSRSGGDEAAAFLEHLLAERDSIAVTTHNTKRKHNRE